MWGNITNLQACHCSPQYTSCVCTAHVYLEADQQPVPWQYFLLGATQQQFGLANCSNGHLATTTLMYTVRIGVNQSVCIPCTIAQSWRIFFCPTPRHLAGNVPSSFLSQRDGRVFLKAFASRLIAFRNSCLSVLRSYIKLIFRAPNFASRFSTEKHCHVPKT